MILVTTAGKVGSETVRLLRQRDMPVRVLVRDPAKARALAEAGAEIAVGDLDVPASLDEAMTGIGTVALVSPAMPAQELNVIRSAVHAGAGHVIKATSKASADSPIARRRWQAEIEVGLAASGIPHTLLPSRPAQPSPRRPSPDRWTCPGSLANCRYCSSARPLSSRFRCHAGNNVP